MTSRNARGTGYRVRRAELWRFVCSVPMNMSAYPLIVIWTLVCILCFPIVFSFWRIVLGWEGDRTMRLFVWLYGRGWLVIMSPFVRFKRMGFDKRNISPPYIIVVNHRSFFDFWCMALLPFSNVAAALRSWPFKMFWFAPFMRLARYLDVESLGWTGCLSSGAEILKKSGVVLFFPEGHRSRDGKLQRFYFGPFKLSEETGINILPLCLTGTDVLLPPGHWWMMPAKICLKALTPIDPKDFGRTLSHITLQKHTKAMIAQGLEELRKA
mgnify:CR=1 FL=1